MSSGCGDVLSLEDLKTAKKHQLFEAEVITGKQGGVAGGTDIDYATNQVTGQVQKTLPAVLRDAGFRPASFTFATGGTLGVNDADLAVLWPAPGGDGQYYSWHGALPKTIPAGSSPTSTGGVSNTAWKPVGDITLRTELASTTGASLVGKTGGGTVQTAINDMVSNAALTGRLVFANKDGGLDNTGATDISAGVLSFLNANKGKFIIFEKGTYNFAGVKLSGTGWEGTIIMFQGTHLLTANPNTGGSFPSTGGNYGGTWSGLIISEGVSDLTLYYRGDGNRVNQLNEEHHFNLVYDGCANIKTPVAEIKEVRGDGIYVNRNISTFTNSSNLYFGYVNVVNSAQDGRNGMSVVSCDGGHVDYFRSLNVGGVVGGITQPGGFDIEPNLDAGFTFLVRGFTVDRAIAINPGGAGVGIIGNIANNFLVRDCHIKQAHVRGGNGSLRLMGCRDSSLSGTVENTTNTAAFISSASRCNFDAQIINCAFAAYIGHTGDASDCNIRITAGGMTNSGVVVASATRTNIQADIISFNTAVASNFIGLWVRNVSNLAGAQIRDCSFTVNCPASSGALFAMDYFTGALPADVAFNGTNAIRVGSCFSGYSSFAAVTGGLGLYLRKDQNIPGLTIVDAISLSSGTYKAGDIVTRNTLSGTIYGYYRVTTGSGHLIGTDWRSLNVT